MKDDLVYKVIFLAFLGGEFKNFILEYDLCVCTLQGYAGQGETRNFVDHFKQVWPIFQKLPIFKIMIFSSSQFFKFLVLRRVDHGHGGDLNKVHKGVGQFQFSALFSENG